MNISPKILVTIFFVNLIHLSNAQTVEVIRKSGFTPLSKDNDFAFIEPSTDTTNINFIATIKAIGSGGESDIGFLYHKLKDKANELGANCFKLDSFNKIDSTTTSTLILDTYYGSDSVLNLNFQGHEKNAVYIFGNPEKSEKTYTFKLNDIKEEIKGGTYFKHQNKEGEEVKISKGGFTGATVWLKWKENRPLVFLSLSGFGVGGGPVPYGTIGASFNTGRINDIEGGLGHILLLLLNPGE